MVSTTDIVFISYARILNGNNDERCYLPYERQSMLKFSLFAFGLSKFRNHFDILRIVDISKRKRKLVSKNYE